MEQQISNQEILEKIREIQIDVDIIKERLLGKEPLLDVEKQLEMGLKDMKKGKSIKLK